MHRQSFLVSLLIVAFLASVAPERAWAQDRDDDTLRERFLKEAPQRWAEYRKRAEKLQGRYSVLFTGTINKQENRSQVVWKQATGAKLVTIVAEQSTNGQKRPTHHEVSGINSRYAFHLERNGPHASWILLQVDDLGRASVSEKTARRLDDSASGLTQLVRLNNQLLEEVVKKPYFKVLRCSRVEMDGKTLARIAFSYQHDTNRDPPPQNPVQGGTMVLDPDRFWCLHSCDLQASAPPISPTGTIKQSFAFHEKDADYPVPLRIEHENNWTFAQAIQGAAGNKQRWVWEFDLNEPSSLPPVEEFTLSAFGLPEPLGIEWKTPTPWWLWGAVTAFGVFIIAGCFAWLKRRSLSRS